MAPHARARGILLSATGTAAAPPPPRLGALLLLLAAGPRAADAAHELPAIIQASLDGDRGRVEALVAQGAAVDTWERLACDEPWTGCTLQTPMHIAAGRGDWRLILFLLDNGAYENLPNQYGLTALFYVAKYGHSTQDGHLNTTTILINRGAQVNYRDKLGQTPLHIAAGHGNHAVAKILLDNGAQINAQNDTGWTPLHLAARQGHSTLTHLLLQHGAEIDAANSAGRTPLYVSVSSGVENVTDLLLKENAALDIQDNGFGLTPLQWAVTRAYPVMVRLLLNEGAAVGALSVSGAASGQLGKTALCWAVADDRLDLSELLLTRGAQVDARGDTGWTELHWAAMLGRRSLAELLLSYSAQVDARDDHDRTPLHWATRKGHMQLVRLLLDSQATPDLASSAGKTPLHWAVRDGKYGMAELILGYDPFVDARDNKNQTPLHEAATKSLLTMSRLLLDHGASVNLKNDYPLPGESGWSHLHWAVFRGAYQMAKMLVEDYSAQVDTVDSYLRTPLHLATRYNFPRMVELLVLNGASMNALNWEGRTPMQSTGHGRIIRLLESFSP